MEGRAATASLPSIWCVSLAPKNHEEARDGQFSGPHLPRMTFPPFLSLPVPSTYHSAMSMTESTQAGWLRLAVVSVSVLLPPSTSFAQKPFLDVPPAGRENVRSAEGGGMKVTLDTTTPLPVLVKRLEGNWREVETGKAYWIGYTDDMYSIAAHGDDAIAPLIALARTTTSDHAKYGAVLTLHLLGIERQSAIPGRPTCPSCSCTSPPPPPMAGHS